MANSGTGFGRVTDRTERHQHQSWGRTRQPKNLAGPHGTTAVVLADDQVPGALTAESGYATENQRYLHLQATTIDDHAYNIEIWFFSHAFGNKWFQLEAPAEQTFTTPNGAAKLYKKIEISGLDRVAFIRSAALGAGETYVSLIAAGSTF
jgi:hypothetical protein